MLNYRDGLNADEADKAITTYHEKKIDKTLFRVTSIYKGEIELKKALEDLTIRRILRDENLLRQA